MSGKFKAFVQITRPVNVIIAFLTIVVAAVVAGSIEPVSNVLFAAVSAALITIGANVINDYYDIEIDRINKPHRPLPSGTIKKQEALTLFIISYTAAWGIAALNGYQMFLIAFVFGILLFFYSSYFKRTVLMGNFVVSLATGMAFIYGGMSVHMEQNAIFPALFGFFFHFGREIVKDVQDMKGDATHGAKTFAIVYGTRNSLNLMNIIFFILIILTIVPYLTGIYGIYYLILVVIGVNFVLVFVMISCWINPDPRNLGKMSNLLKADMFIGLIAIYIG